MVNLLFLLAVIFVCTLVFVAAEAAVFFVFHGRLCRVAGDRSHIIEPIDPVAIDFPVGIAKFTAPISKDNVTPLKSAYSTLAPKLRLAGPASALLCVALYGALVLLVPSSWVPFLSIGLLSLPLMGFANSGLRGFVADRRKFGEIYAYLNQLYVGGFTTVSFLVVALFLVLGYLQILP